MNELKVAIATPSLYDEAINLMVKAGLAIDPKRAERDPTAATVHDESVEAAWREAGLPIVPRWFMPVAKEGASTFGEPALAAE